MGVNSWTKRNQKNVWLSFRTGGVKDLLSKKEPEIEIEMDTALRDQDKMKLGRSYRQHLLTTLKG